MKNQIRMLKVKIKSLAAESQMIRAEERKCLVDRTPKNHQGFTPEFVPSGSPGGEKKPKKRRVSKYRKEKEYRSLREHRVHDVRKETRCALLAYAYLRGKSFESTEGKRLKPASDIDWSRVKKLVEKFGSTTAAVNYVSTTELMNWSTVRTPVAV